LPAIASASLTGSKTGSKRFKTWANAQGDLELRDLRAEGRPGEGRVHVDDVSARAVGDRLEQIATGAVDLGERDEGAAQILTTAQAEVQEPRRSCV
jgi:hypothetical protein